MFFCFRGKWKECAPRKDRMGISDSVSLKAPAGHAAVALFHTHALPPCM